MFRRGKPDKFELTEERLSILHGTTIDQHRPGTILADFQTVLDFVNDVSPPLTGKRLLPMRTLIPLNERMSHPLQHGLNRPQQKSFPHINEKQSNASTA